MLCPSLGYQSTEAMVPKKPEFPQMSHGEKGKDCILVPATGEFVPQEETSYSSDNLSTA